MSANQFEHKLCYRSCSFVLEGFRFWPFTKEASTSSYVLIPSFCFRKGTNQINPYCMPHLVSHWDGMDTSWGLVEFGVSTLAFVTGSCYMQDILDDTHPVVSLLNFLHNFVSTKVSSTDWVIMASLEDLSLLVRFDNL